MLCNSCGNEAHCGEKLTDEVNGIKTIECKKCTCQECKDFEKYNREDEWSLEILENIL
jgi:hypothetical protein